MKYLLVGNPGNFWVQNFVKNYLKYLPVEIWMVSNKKEEKFVEDFFRENKINVIRCLADRSRTPLFRYFFDMLKFHIEVKKNGPYDIINIHYVSSAYLKLARVARGKDTYMVASYYGSDILRADIHELKKNSKYLKDIDYFTFDSLDLKVKFEQIYGNKLKGKKEYLPFGLSTLNEIDKLEGGREKGYYKRQLGISPQKTVIAVGYNRIPEQQHISVLEELEKLLDNVKKNDIVILLQMTYGKASKEYVDNVISKAKSLGCELKVYTEFLTEEMIAKIRLATDIYINAQITDAFCGTVCEVLYAKNILLNASWLCYEEFEKLGIEYVEFEKFENLSQTIMQYFKEKHCMNLEQNKIAIGKVRSWKELKKRWDGVIYPKLEEK